jgi:hypothetical protein
MEKSKFVSQEPEYIPGYGWEVSLDETTCDARTLECLRRPDAEREMSIEDWDKLYDQRFADGYYERKKAREAAIDNDPRLEGLCAFDNGYFELREMIEKEYPALV